MRAHPEWAAERERLAPYLHAPLDKTLAFVAEMEIGVPEGPVVYACPMHPDVVSDKPDHCPKCGMKLLPAELIAQTQEHGAHAPHGDAHEHAHTRAMSTPATVRATSTRTLVTDTTPVTKGHAHDAARGDDHASHGRAHDGEEHHGHGHHGGAGSIEWEDDMVDVNRLTTPANMHWNLVDRETGAVNRAIDWQFRVGDQVKLRLVNEMDSDHPMHHPFHIHGAGRSLVLARDGIAETNLVWRDTVLGANRRDRGHPARRDEPRHLDGALPYRRAPRERDDVQLQRRSVVARRADSDRDRAVSQASEPVGSRCHSLRSGRS